MLGVHFGGGKGSGSGKEKGKQGNGFDGPREQIKEKPLEVTMVNTHVPKSQAQVAQEKWEKHVDQCKNSFGGVGLLYFGMDGTVEKVYKNYPAYNAGVEPGDQVVNMGEIRGEIGTDVTIQVMRGSLRLDFPVKRGKICLEDAIKEMKDAKSNDSGGP